MGWIEGVTAATPIPFEHHTIDDAAVRRVEAAFGVGAAMPDAHTRALIRSHYSDARIFEPALGVGLFPGMSKVLVNLGLEPENTPVTLVPTP